jgi:hypothetical protein
MPARATRVVVRDDHAYGRQRQGALRARRLDFDADPGAAPQVVSTSAPADALDAERHAAQAETATSATSNPAVVVHLQRGATPP